MGIFFVNGEKKTRPGVYNRYENAGANSIAGAVDGICAVTVKSNWGAVGEVVTLENTNDIYNKLGTGGANGTLNIIEELFNGGAVRVYAVRLGTGGTKGTATLQDTTEAPVDAVTLTLKYEGDRPLKCTIREVLGDSSSHEFVLIENNVIQEKLTYPVSENEVDALIALINANSQFVTAAKKESYTGTNKIALVTNVGFTGGTNPTTSNEDYSKAFTVLEPYQWNTICTDSDTLAVSQLLTAYMDRVFQNGKMAFAVVGEPTSVDFGDRLTHAKAFNDFKTVYVGGGWEDAAGVQIQGARAAARIAGMIAAVPSSESMTHRVIDGAVRPLEVLTNSQYEQAIENGMLTFSVSSGGVVWCESGITTLTTLDTNEDEGWKKIKRTKIRFELMTRASNAVEPLVGKIINNSDGQSNVMQVVQGVINEMIGETKLLAGSAIQLDDSFPAVGDSAQFIITANDSDSLEKIYLVYKFQYSANA